ncbi:MAG: aminotransferase class III-fold pyridoxal phosphate-dependent enzyme, partial [Solirubrobacterales bacterium]
PGVTAAQAGEVTVVAWNDHEGFERAVEQAGSSLAAVIAEPIPANMGVVPPRPGFLESLRKRCDATGALLVADEVVTGFRVASGGAAELLDLRADLTMLGKVLGGGLPLAAVVGQRGLMEHLAPVGETYQAGTLSGNPLATAAGLATLELLDHAAYARLERTTERLASGLREQAAHAGVAVHVTAVCGLVTVFFTERPVTGYDDARNTDSEVFSRFFNEMLARGIYLPPSPFEAWFPSLAHTDGQIDETIEAAGGSFAGVAGS